MQSCLKALAYYEFHLCCDICTYSIRGVSYSVVPYYMDSNSICYRSIHGVHIHGLRRVQEKKELEGIEKGPAEMQALFVMLT